MILGQWALLTKRELVTLCVGMHLIVVIAHRNTKSSDKTEQRKKLQDHRTLEKSLCEAFLLGCDLDKRMSWKGQACKVSSLPQSCDQPTQRPP